jgi:Molecular chaperone (small heat shock protein)
MTLIKFEPIREFESFTNRVQKLFGDFPSLSLDMNLTYHPKIDISEDEKNIFVDAEVAGIPKENLKVVLQDNILTISGEKKQEEVKKEKNYHRTERSYGSFSRSFTMPVEVDQNKVSAAFENGILKISLEKAAPKVNNEKMIDIK